MKGLIILVILVIVNLLFAIHGTAKWQIIMNAFTSGFVTMAFIACLHYYRKE